MSPRLPLNPPQLRRQLLCTMGAVGIAAAAVAASIAYVLTTLHVERAASERVRSGFRHFDTAAMRGLLDVRGTGHDDLVRLLETEHFIGVRLRADDGTAIEEVWARDLDPAVLEAARAARPRVAGDLLRWKKEAFVSIARPLPSGEPRTGLTVEAIYRLDPETVHTLDPQVRRAAVIAAAAVLLATLVLYPVLLGLTRRSWRLSRDLLGSNLDLMRTLGSAIALRDSDTDAHNYRVTLYAVSLAEAAGLRPAEIANLIAGAFLHDVGKIGIPDAILLKPAKLTPDEFGIMRRHPVLGEGIVAGSAWLGRARVIVRHHHEHFDGSGYPDGLAGRAIPLSARLFALADVFDALTTRRPYKPALPLEQALQIMRVEMTGQFDPALRETFEAHAPRLFRTIGQAPDGELHSALAAALQRYYRVAEAGPEPPVPSGSA